MTYAVEATPALAYHLLFGVILTELHMMRVILTYIAHGRKRHR